MDKKNAVFRYIAYAVEMVLAFVLLSTPNLLPDIFGAKPALLLGIALSIATFEREIPAMIFGMVAGALMDFGYSNALGLFTIALTVVCFLIGWVANNLVKANPMNYLLTAAVVIGGLYMLYFGIEFYHVADRWTYFQAHLISRMIQTLLWSAVWYFVNRFVYHTLSEET